jgi:hypothetical protein
MERLTEEDYGDSYCLKKCHPNDCYCEDMNCPINNCGELIEALRKLGEYEKAEEQGLLVRLPCKVGDMVYKLWYYDGKPYKIQRHVIKTLSELCGTMESKKFGKSVFLTSEEAEKKLEELENGK